jgi:hypothetical protein
VKWTLIVFLAWLAAIVLIMLGWNLSKRRVHARSVRLAAYMARPTPEPEPEYATVEDILDRIEPYRQAADQAIEQANSWPSHTVPPRYVAPNPYPPLKRGGER